jgi:bifunctional non-homologous end joining protein LigD
VADKDARGFLAPMLATPYPKPFDDPAWWFEVKWDGYRTIVNTVDRPKAFSRRGTDLVARFPALGPLLARLPAGWIWDGELIGEHLSGWGSLPTARQPLTLALFDCLYGHGQWFLDLPLAQRLERLRQSLVEPIAGVRLSPGLAGQGTALWPWVQREELEGMMAKRLDSAYRPGQRSPSWRKILALKSDWFTVARVEPRRAGGRWWVAVDAEGRLAARLFAPGEAPAPRWVRLGYRGRSAEGRLRHPRVLGWRP